MVEMGESDASILGLVFSILMSLLILVLPRRLAALPFLVGVCYITRLHLIQVGPFHFNAIRILIFAGITRILCHREWLVGGLNGLDCLMGIWGGWALISSLFHDDFSASLIFRMGLVYNTFGIYFLFRIFCDSLEDVISLIRFAAIMLFPVALAMVYEKATMYNLFSFFGDVSATSTVRYGVIRAQGPFAHPILAGTVGAVTFPLMIGLWQWKRKTAFIGLVACLAMVFSCGSSGPILSLAAGIGALFMWYFRQWMKFARWIGFLGYIGLDVVMKAPAYYLLGRIDLTGGSTGWHRAALIQSAFKHIDEWWFAGTDHTRHWMPTGVSWSPKHTDITNHYLGLGVLGGLPLMLLFIGIILKSFSYIGMILKESDGKNQFLIWAFGASLFAHAATCISVYYFDQTFLFLYLTIGAISSIWSTKINEKFKKDEIKL
jgi:hypothetical protein